MSKKDFLKGYLETKVNPILERLVVDLLVETPDDIVMNA
jgi:hypothetical protein